MADVAEVDGKETGERGPKPRTVTVTVNNAPVRLPEREVTGREVKLAAIEQGVQIEVGFQLSQLHGQRYRVVGDEDTIRVHSNAEFLAVAPDDNS